MIRPTVLLTALVAIGCADYRGSGVTAPRTDGDRAIVTATHIVIPFYRNHYSEYERDCPLMYSILAGCNDWDGTETKIHRRESLGSVIVELGSGSCAYVESPPRPPAREGPWVASTEISAEQASIPVAEGTRVYRINAAGLLVDPPRPRDARLSRVRDGRSWRVPYGIARVDDSLFIPTDRFGVVELDEALGERRIHIDPGALPGPSEWLAPVSWQLGQAIGERMLVEENGRLRVAGTRRSADLGPSSDAVVSFSGEFAAGSETLVHLKTLTTSARFGRDAKIAPHDGGHVIVSRGQTWQARNGLDFLEPFATRRTAFVGWNGAVMVFHRSDATVSVFSPRTRTWQAHDYNRCRPHG